jgi:uncharacterized membrane protein
MKKPSVTNVVVAFIALSPLAYLAVRWRSIPSDIILRFDFARGFESTESRAVLIVSSIILSFASIGIYAIMSNLQTIDPKVTIETPKSAFDRLGLVVAFFLTTLNYLFVLVAEHGWTVNANFACGLFGMLIATLGNYFYSLRQNHFAGIRLPWTLRDSDNWRKTHQLTGKVWVFSGLVLIASATLLPVSWGLIAITSAIITAIPTAYSYKLHRSKQMA